MDTLKDENLKLKSDVSTLCMEKKVLEEACVDQQEEDKAALVELSSKLDNLHLNADKLEKENKKLKQTHWSGTPI